MTRTYWTHRAYCDRRALIAARLGIPAADVSFDQMLADDAGEMETAEACDWPKLPPASISSGPYHTAPLARGREPYTVSPTLYADAGKPFPDDDWPGLPNTLITEGSGGE